MPRALVMFVRKVYIASGMIREKRTWKINRRIDKFLEGDDRPVLDDAGAENNHCYAKVMYFIFYILEHN